MSEMEIASDARGEGMEGSMDVHYLFISSRSPTTFYLEVGGKLCPGFKLPWICSLTVCLKYGDIVVGDVTVPDMRMTADDENNMYTKWDETIDPIVEIKNMTAFASFLRGVMPNKNTSSQLDSQKRTTAHLSVTPHGHALTMSIDLSRMAKMIPTVTSVKIVDTKISITVEITNLSSLKLLFEEGTFTLNKGQRIIGMLNGFLDIVPGKFAVEFDGEMQKGVSGIATLKGHFYEDMDMSWQEDAIKLFEVEVNLDGVDTDGH